MKIKILMDAGNLKSDIEILVKNINLSSNEFIDFATNVNLVLGIIQDNITVDITFSVFTKYSFVEYNKINSIDYFNIIYSKQMDLNSIYNIPKTLDITCTVNILLK